ncbi:MAG: A/G-specific adenine glycosylase, partial [Limisphaerales bacterium]
MASAAPLVRSLLDWFAVHARDLPWRRTRDPWAVLVSEVMLQQTQVRTVIPYWERWMRRFPDAASLAAVGEDEVLKAWEGLGYYRRARSLQAAARALVAEHAGLIPRGFDDILALPGVGRYTAGAVASIAFNQPAPILDGNVIRVLARLFAVEGDPAARGVNARLWEIAGELVTAAARREKPGERACSALNQSLMELGATVCTPKAPGCPACPVRRRCAAHRTGRVAELPAPRARPATSARRFLVIVAE